MSSEETHDKHDKTSKRDGTVLGKKKPQAEEPNSKNRVPFSQNRNQEVFTSPMSGRTNKQGKVKSTFKPKMILRRPDPTGEANNLQIVRDARHKCTPPSSKSESSSSSRDVTDIACEGKVVHKTYEQREQEYAAARLRIMGPGEPASAGQKDACLQDLYSPPKAPSNDRRTFESVATAVVSASQLGSQRSWDSKNGDVSRGSSTVEASPTDNGHGSFGRQTRFNG